jgi:hypothetical protein
MQQLLSSSKINQQVDLVSNQILKKKKLESNQHVLAAEIQ